MKLELLTDREIMEITGTLGTTAAEFWVAERLYKQVAQAQLDSIKAQFNKPYDKPDSKGWWWFRHQDKPQEIEPVMVLGSLGQPWSTEIPLPIDKFPAGKWYKADIGG